MLSTSQKRCPCSHRKGVRDPPPTGCWSISLVNIEIMAAENIKAMAVLVQATSAYTDNTAKNK